MRSSYSPKIAALRKLAPRGPVVRLSALPSQLANSGSADAGRVLARDDWNTGRDLASEERRCGMLLRLSDLSASAVAPKARHKPHAATPLSQTAPPPTGLLLDAVVKAHHSDFQVNEVHADGAAAFLERAPKGRWRKASRSKLHLVENAPTPFSDPGKTYNPLVMHHGEYVQRVGRLPKDTPLLSFAVYREGYSLDSVLNRFRYQVGVGAEAVYFSALGNPQTPSPTPSSLSCSSALSPSSGSFGCITQFGCCVGVTREQLAHVSRHYSLRPLLMDPRGYHPLHLLASLTAPPWGYFYRLLLRCVGGEDEGVILAAMRRMAQAGFINYYGLESFGVSDSSLFEMAAMAAEGHHHTAVGCYFQSLAESDPLHHEHYLAYVNAEDSTAAAFAAEWAAACTSAKCTRRTQNAVSGLAAYHERLSRQRADWSGQTSEDGRAERDACAKELWDLLGVEEAARQSAARFVWNAMATQRLRIGEGTSSAVLVGDTVEVPPVEPGAPPVYHVIANEEEASRFSITDVVLPVPSSKHPGSGVTASPPPLGVDSYGKLCDELAAKHRFRFLSPLPADGTAPEYRHLVVKPLQFQAAVVRDPSSFTALKSDWFLRQERKPFAALDLDYENRVREPSVFNVSERFAERMAAVRGRHSGSYSVALSFLLPNGASPLVALRESFALKHLNFTDLYYTS